MNIIEKLKLACAAFLKAWREPLRAQLFLSGTLASKAPQEKELAHLTLLSALQHQGRLLDFLKEDLSGCSDAEVGAVARKIHEDCAQVLEDLVSIRPLKSEPEGSKITVAKGYDPSEIRVVGKVRGEPPFTAILVHRGWRAEKKALPKKNHDLSGAILCPAEVEVIA